MSADYDVPLHKHERIQAEPDKVRRVMADVQLAVAEKRVKTTPARMAEFNWKTFQ